MATAQPQIAAVVVNSSNAIIESGGSAGSAHRYPQLVVRAVSSTGKIIESNLAAGSVDGGIPQLTLVLVDSSNKVFASNGTTGSDARQAQIAVRIVDSSSLDIFTSDQLHLQATVRIVDASNTILDTLFGGGGGGFSPSLDFSDARNSQYIDPVINP
jgi:hypothetical protein